MTNVGVSTNLNACIGRYAYIVYDVSGMLDANVAGSPVTSSTTGQKGSSALADLTPILSAVQVDPSPSKNFLGWRNNNTPSFLTDIYGANISPGNPQTPGLLETGMRSGTNGWNLFLSRHDMLQYSEANPTLFPSQMIPYFRTFSRDANAPEIDAAIPGRTGFIASSATRDIPYYTLDAQKKTFSVKQGDPFLQRKFPLSRLRWFDQKDATGAPTGSYADAIKQHFGLTWVSNLKNAGISAPEYSGVGGYVYTSPDGSTAVSSIKTLDQVETAGREPDFFEWLKAAIVNTSVGISGGNTNTNVADGEDQKQDFQLIQIGANIIDQADADDIPTLIATATAKNRNSEPLVAMGVENLPYVNEVIASFHRPTTAPDELHGYLQFELWNPHQNAANIPKDYTGSSLTGSRFRIRAVEGTPWIDTYVRIYATDISGTTIPEVQKFSSNARTIVPKNFTGSSSDTVSFAYTEIDFSEPRLLGDDLTNTTTDAMVTRNNRSVRSGPNPESSSFKGIDGGYALAKNPGIPAGTVLTFSNSTVTLTSGSLSVAGVSHPLGEKYYNTAAFTCLASGITNSPAVAQQNITMVAEMQLSNGSWVPYQSMEGLNNICINTIDYPTSVRDNSSGGGTPNLGWSPLLPVGVTGTAAADWTKWNWSNPGGSGTGTQKPFSTILTGPITSFAYYGWDVLRNHCSVIKADPRTRRFGLSAGIGTWGASAGTSIRETANAFTNNGDATYANCNWDTATTRAVGNDGSGGVSAGGLLANWTAPLSSFGPAVPMAFLARNLSSDIVNYKDNDGNTVRPADCAYLPDASFPTIPGQTLARPVVLNRPFRSVAELGYVFRDLPWKSLDFFSPLSAGNPLSPDLHLLDVFCIEANFSAAGKVNPNTASKLVLQSLLQGAAKNSADFAVGSQGTIGNADVLAQTLVTDSAVGSAGMMGRSSDIVARLMADPNFAAATNKIYREAYVRGLIGATDCRTWNLMIDVIAQSGRLPPSATKLQQFSVSGERRYWGHVAIDRETGRIVDLVLEPAYD